METELQFLNDYDYNYNSFEHETFMERFDNEDFKNIIENDYDVDTSQPITLNSIWNDNEQNTDIDVSATNSAVPQQTENCAMLLTEDHNYKTANLEYRNVRNMNLQYDLLQYGETENFLQEVKNLEPELKLEEDRQRIVNFEEESTFNMNTYRHGIKTEKKEIINDLFLGLYQETHELEKESANKSARKREKKTNENIKDKQEDQENCIDVETISDEKPVLQARNIKSLLEKFEASENPRKKPRNKSTIKNDFLPAMKPNTMQQMTQKYQNQVLEKLPSQISNQHKRTSDYVSKEVIDRIKASGRKRAIAIIPAMPNVQNKSRNSNNTQEVGATFSHNKVLKQVTSDAKIDDNLVQLDHDYCIGSATKSCDSSKFTKDTSVLKLNQNKKMLKCNDKIVKCHNNSNLKKDSVEVTDIYDTSKLAVCTSLQTDKETDKINENRFEKGHKDYQQKICVEQSHLLKDSLAIKLPKNNVIIPNKSSNTDSSVYIIHSALAKSILRNDSKNTLQANSKTQMISVLKKPPPNASQSLNKSQSSFLKSNSDETTVTTATNSLNNKVENIILQDIKDLPSDEQMKKPPFRKKLNLAEYRNRRDQNRSDNSRTNSPIQPKMLEYVHHASTTTEPIKNDPENPIWCEREIVLKSIFKPKSDIDEEKNKLKPLMCDVGIQTYETVFEFSGRSLVDTAKKNDTREENMKDIKQRSYKKDRFYRRSSRSRSKSKSKKRNNSEISRSSRSRSRNGDRSRSRNSNSSSRSRSKSCSRNRSRSISKRKNHCRSRSRSRSCRCSRRRRIRSRRRSSVSSTSSCSSHSRSYTTSTRSRYSSSRSRSSRSRSEYSSCSRSSSYSNYGRSRWSNHQRKSSSDREKSYDRYKRHSYGSHRYKNWRSPVRSYYKSYNWCNREKQRQVEERRVIYVGRLDENTTNADLQKRFEKFGPVVNVSIHLREHGDNYGFVTFKYKDDAYAAIEHGNDNPSLPTYDLSFGGRRAFCKNKYSDLDDTVSRSPISKSSPINEENTFDFLLEEAKAKLRKRKV
ncbi:NK-tumor recognition protein-like [Nylanderia fulva]|uniref:NK-tumor recognition protein-like n=1 Tax=Nylanderia fulva TaxID=613905 RepID=UPI0010FAD929|nr:NK-tumor recognition protein-like [Nylanderia fulva]XP_029156865.1 NK-tumor recognition protein-like [Nylanderia fulva]XP_029156866.1 NK-tumor recognition protein-like [Nylanderia fulva]XP_029156867.1 NK-tumor recognition protein-like [Nylanderia fulva]XP_029156868.1 NK-tumor recognition protein-like [Nylanderia fulva]